MIKKTYPFIIGETIKNSFSFDIDNFLFHQKAITEKFPCPSKELFQIYDNFFGNISEEIYEYQIEKESLRNIKYVDNLKYFEEILNNKTYEAIDIIMYLGSLTVSFINYFNLDLKEMINEYTYLFQNFISSYNNNMTEEKIFENIYHTLSFIRRKIPNRKYHKKETFIDKSLELDKIKEEKVFKLLFILLRDTIFNLFDIIRKEYDYYYNENIGIKYINNMIETKQNKVFYHD